MAMKRCRRGCCPNFLSCLSCISCFSANNAPCCSLFDRESPADSPFPATIVPDTPEIYVVSPAAAPNTCPYTMPPHASLSDAAVASSSAQDVSYFGILTQDDPGSHEAQDDPRPREASSSAESSASVPKVYDVIENIHKDAGAVDGETVVGGENEGSDLDALVTYISLLLELAEKRKRSRELPSQPSSSLELKEWPSQPSSILKLHESVSQGVNVWKDILPGDNSTIVRGILKGIGTANLTTAGILDVANALERLELGGFQENINELFRELMFLAKLVKRLEERPRLIEGRHDIITKAKEIIVESCIVCCVQMKSSKFSRFFAASINKAELSRVKQQIYDITSTALQLLGGHVSDESEKAHQSIYDESGKVHQSTSCSEHAGGFSDTDKVDGLMEELSRLLKLIGEEKKPAETNKAHRFWPTTQSFLRLKDIVSDCITVVTDFIPNDSVKTAAGGLVLGIATAHLGLVGLLVVVTIMERFQDVSQNRDDCRRLLKKMAYLAKLVHQFQEHRKLLEGMHDEVRKSIELIVEGSLMCSSQIKSSKLFRFFTAPIHKRELSGLGQEIDDMLQRIFLQLGICIYNAIECRPRLSISYPEHSVGIDEPVKELIDLLEWGSERNALTVILHGLGGMGKTTLADAVFSRVEIKECKYSIVTLYDDINSSPKITELQKQILKDLMDPKDPLPDIRKEEDGRQALKRVLEKVQAFIYIDNVLNEDKFRRLLPKDMSRAKKVRLIVTARHINVGRACKMKTEFYDVKCLPSTEAKRLLEKEMQYETGDREEQLNPSQLNEMVNICRGIPIVVELVAGFIRSHEKGKLEAYRILMQERNTLNARIDNLESNLFVYDHLPEDLKDPFLDICSFFKGWDWDRVAHIVGDSTLESLRSRALVTRGTNGVATVHDFILMIVRRKTEGTRFRFTRASQFRDFLDKKEEMDFQGITGIWLTDNTDLLSIKAEKLDFMYKSLRILALGNFTTVEGECKKIFENLVFLQAPVPYLPYHYSVVSKLKKLKYLSYQPENLNLPKMPSELEHMELDGRSKSSAITNSSKAFQHLPHLRTLRLIHYVKLEKLPDGLRFLNLKELTLSYCESLKELPGSISELQYLRVLKMDHCSSLTQLPENFGSLKSLEELNFQCCTKLAALPESISQLKSLEVLRMDYCSSLIRLPNEFGSLNSLQELNLQDCENLEELPNSFDKLSSLRSLNLSSCKILQNLHSGSGKLTSLVQLDVSGCRELRSFPENIRQLQSLASLKMSDCLSLKELPDEFCILPVLSNLSLVKCESLYKLSDQFGDLASLKVLNLEGCVRLGKLPKGFSRLRYLEELDLSQCCNLEELCNDFKGLNSLQKLYLNGCKRLEKLPGDFHSLPSLRRLELRDCQQLEEKWMDNVVTIQTLQIVDIEKSPLLVKRWAEIRRGGNQSWPFVYTGQGLPQEEKENIQKNLLPELDPLLMNGGEEPFCLSQCTPDTFLLAIIDYHQNFNDEFPWPLIEETIGDTQNKFEMIYIGNHFNELHGKVADSFLAHAPLNSEIREVFDKVLLSLDLYDIDLQVPANDNRHTKYVHISIKLVEDGKGSKYLSGWKHLSNSEMEDYVLQECRTYHRLKELVKSTQQNNTELLRELFASGEEETVHTFQKSYASRKGRTQDMESFVFEVEELKGKTILLEIRPAEMIYDIRLRSLIEMYDSEGRPDLEIISVPIWQPNTSSDVWEQFSKESPWLVVQNPWMQISRAVKYFLIKDCGWEGDEQLERWYPMWIIEPSGKITHYNSFVDRWGTNAYPFAHEKIKEIREEEWNQLEKMSSLEFIFKHLEGVLVQVKEMIRHRKMICLYGVNDSEIPDYTCCRRNALIALRDDIHVIYIPGFGLKDKETVRLLNNKARTCSMGYSPLKKVKMEGMSQLNLSEYEAMSFWIRLSSLKEEMKGMDYGDKKLCSLKKLCSVEKLCSLKNLLHSFDYECLWMALMDEDGEMLTQRGKVLAEMLSTSSTQHIAKELMHSLIQVSKEQKQEALSELEQSLELFEKYCYLLK